MEQCLNEARCRCMCPPLLMLLLCNCREVICLMLLQVTCVSLEIRAGVVQVFPECRCEFDDVFCCNGCSGGFICRMLQKPWLYKTRSEACMEGRIVPGF